MIDVGEILAIILRAFRKRSLVAPGITKVVKILYLFEVSYYQKNRERATDLKWRFLHFGPYPDSFPTIMKNKGYEIEEEELEDGGIFKRLKESPLYDLEKIPTSDISCEIVLERLVKEWGAKDLYDLLDFVYYETEPMFSVKRGDVLDFSKIQKIKTEESKLKKINRKKLKQLQESVEARVKEIEAQYKPSEVLIRLIEKEQLTEEIEYPFDEGDVVVFEP
jgi:hypothetical protein